MNKKLLAMLLLATTITSIPLPTEAKPYVEVADTFTYNNANSIAVKLGNTIYMVTADNGIVAKGTDAYGVSTTSKVDTQGEWRQLIKNAQGDRYTNVVGLEIHNNVLVIKTNTGELYSLGGTYYVPALYGSTYTHKTSSSRMKLTASISDNVVNFSGSATHYRSGSGTFTKTIKDTLDLGTGTVHKLNTMMYNKDANTSIDGVSTVLVLTEDDKLYRCYVTGTGSQTDSTTGMNIKGLVFNSIKDFKIKSLSEFTAQILTNKGTLFTYDTKNNTSVNNTFSKDGKDITQNIFVTSILNSNEPGTLAVVKTNEGIFVQDPSTQSSFIYSAELTNIKPVSIGSNYLIAESGHLYTTDTTNDWSNPTKHDFQDWQYENPIMPSEELANFEITANKLYGRKDSFDLTFNLITARKPTAFNLYYVKSENIGDKSKWETIASSIPYESFTAVEEDTGYITSAGRPVVRTKYTYNWNTELGDLTHIQIIAEPIYS